MKEQVLVFPASMLKWLHLENGFSQPLFSLHFYKDIMTSKHLSFLNRESVEGDENFKQLIGYTVLKRNSKYFAYKRTKKGGEKRLHDLWSIGVGGHTSLEDSVREISNLNAVEKAILRELKEEVGIELSGEEFKKIASFMGIIYSGIDAVSRVHCGVLYVVDLDEREIRSKDPALSSGDFEAIDILKKNKIKFENWSQIVINSGILN